MNLFKKIFGKKQKPIAKPPIRNLPFYNTDAYGTYNHMEDYNTRDIVSLYNQPENNPQTSGGSSCSND